VKEQKKARRLFDRLTRKLRIELLRSGAFKALKRKSRPRDGSYKITHIDGMEFFIHVIGRHVLVNLTAKTA